MPENKVTPTSFVATIYGNLTPLNNSALSKARVRIFYKGLNRNGSFITDEIADQLIASLPGTPVVGSYDADHDDFLGHVEASTSKAYGFVPEDMNFNWETNLDPDGVSRTYACADVILWTGRYPLASRVVGQSHSMELNPNTVEGHWVETPEDFYFEFTKAEFFGLCILGNQEPCFEGSAFYSLKENINQFSKLKSELKELAHLYYSAEENDEENNQTGGQEMEDDDKNLNPQGEEEVVDNVPVDGQEPEVEDEGAAPTEDEATDFSNDEEGSEESSNDEEDSEDEAPEGESEESQSEEEEDIEAIKADYTKQLEAKDQEIAGLKKELEQLRGYKLQKIEEEKDAVLDAYSAQLSDEEIENFKNKKESYASALDFKKDIALCIVEKAESRQETQAEPTDYSFVGGSGQENLSAVEAMVANYVASKNK